MSNLLDLMTNVGQFNSGNDMSIGKDLLRKILDDGDNTFRVVGTGKVFYTHRFVTKDGESKISICTKDSDGNGKCRICNKHRAAWSVIQSSERGEGYNHTPEEISEAKIIVGKTDNPVLGFPQSWGAKRMVALQVIDRDSNVNAKEKHLSVLCKSDYEFGVSAFRRGIHELIVKLVSRPKYRQEIQANLKKGYDWLPWDVILTREGKGMNTSYDRDIGDSDPLTPEEQAYKRYDLDSILIPTPDSKLLAWLEGSERPESDEDEGANDEMQEELDSCFGSPKVEKPKSKLASKKKPAPKKEEEESEVFDELDEMEELIADEPPVKKTVKKKPKPEPEPEPELDDSDLLDDDLLDEEFEKPTKPEKAKPKKTKVTKPKKEEPEEDFVVFEDEEDEEEVETKPTKAKSKTVQPKEKPKAKKVKEEDVEMDNCPSCDKLIAVTSTSCKFCGCEFEGYEDI